MRFAKGPQRVGKAFALAWVLFTSTSALAQTTIANTVAGNDPEYEVEPVTVGPFQVSPSVMARTMYDTNVLADPDGAELEDVEFLVRPELVARVGDQGLRLRIEGYGEFSRYADLTNENSDTYGVSGDVVSNPDENNQLHVRAGYARLKENRGDPEARNLVGLGPRLYDSIFANLDYRRTGGRTLFSVETSYSKIDATSPIDDDRDFTTYVGRATAGYRVSGPIFATVTGYVNVRDFRIGATPTGPDRDATTYGAQAGVDFIDSERLRGRARLGFFRFDPSDPTLDGRTGFSANVLVSYLPTRRTAIIVDVFNGDVATSRRGAQSRTDSRVTVTGQVEMRHNLYGRASLRYMRNKYIGSGIEERSIGGNLALEFLAGKGLSFIAEVQASDRQSDDPTQEFDRFRTSLSARLRF
ncbi:outer membrane beta-barrel protein [Aurantiacibacter flavus]|uniref:Outer membrane beta-barrel protein n=1 Tax=Aurantiacibacter flavus TaxID=3145232 RepID=A0ABV0CYS2_9SPHN